MKLFDNKKWNIKKILKEIAIMALMVLMISNILSYIRKPELADSRLPVINVLQVNGEQFESSGSEGKPLLIHFWATWCPACSAEADNIERLSNYFNVVTFAVKSGSDEEIKRYMQKRGFHYRVINDREGTWARLFSVEGYPTSFIYDSDGRVSSSEVGYTSTLGMALRLWWAN